MSAGANALLPPPLASEDRLGPSNWLRLSRRGAGLASAHVERLRSQQVTPSGVRSRSPARSMGGAAEQGAEEREVGSAGQGLDVGPRTLLSHGGLLRLR